MIYNYKKLITWQKAIELVDEVYKLSKLFLDTERYGLVSQMKRSAVSIPSNIAEGCMRGTKKEYRYYILVAFASGAELETQVIISKRQDFISLIECKKTDSLLD